MSEKDLCMLLMAAWFHDVGWLFDETEHPELTSIIIMKRYLQANHAAANLVEQACDCIRAIASQPLLSHLSEKIICDAVTYDYGTPFFRETSSYKPPATLAILNNHVYYTEYCQLRLSRGKLENIQWLKTLM